MTRPMFRLTMGHMMLVVAILGLSYAVSRVNVALAVIAACVSSMTLMRTVHLIRHQQGLGMRAGPWRWFLVGLSSLLISAAIVGSCDFTFMFVYGLAEAVGRRVTGRTSATPRNRLGRYCHRHSIRPLCGLHPATMALGSAGRLERPGQVKFIAIARGLTRAARREYILRNYNLVCILSRVAEGRAR